MRFDRNSLRWRTRVGRHVAHIAHAWGWRQVQSEEEHHPRQCTLWRELILHSAGNDWDLSECGAPHLVLQYGSAPEEFEATLLF